MVDNPFIVFEIPESWGKDFDTIDITKSSIEDFNDYKIQIKNGRYKVVNNLVFLEYEFL
ncbi:MAG TPA: hypothetical protein VFF21_02460 [Flavobacteriaceae bacterium]|nr:hypothetical protein [Flavobacteriaceae bacterium]